MSVYVHETMCICQKKKKNFAVQSNLKLAIFVDSLPLVALAVTY